MQTLYKYYPHVDFLSTVLPWSFRKFGTVALSQIDLFLTDKLREGLYTKGTQPAFPPLSEQSVLRMQGFCFASCGTVYPGCGGKCCSRRINLIPGEIITSHRAVCVLQLSFTSRELYTLITSLFDINISQLILLLVVGWHGE